MFLSLEATEDGAKQGEGAKEGRTVGETKKREAKSKKARSGAHPGVVQQVVSSVCVCGAGERLTATREEMTTREEMK